MNYLAVIVIFVCSMACCEAHISKDNSVSYSKTSTGSTQDGLTTRSTTTSATMVSTKENDMEFRKRLRQHGLSESTIQVLEDNGIVDLQTLRALTEKDITDLGLDIGQRSRLRSLRDKLEKEENENIENMSEETFWCLFKCLGGIGAVGLGGILALAGLVAVGLPAIGFTAIGITAGSLAASIMSLYGGAVGAGSLVAILQSVAAAGLGWGTILTTFFGTSTVYAAAKGACSHCFS